MEDLVVFTALNHSGPFGKNFVKLKINKYIVYQLRVGPFTRYVFHLVFSPSMSLILYVRRRYFTIRSAKYKNTKV